jgi:hypothetical protein
MWNIEKSVTISKICVICVPLDKNKNNNTLRLCAFVAK